MKTSHTSCFTPSIQRPAVQAFVISLMLFVVASVRAVTPAQVTYDVWGGNVPDPNLSYYNVDKMAGFVKLGSTNRSATFSGQYNYYVVAVRGGVLYLDAAQTSTGAYYNNGSLATGNASDTVNGAFGSPDRVYLVMNGTGAGGGSTYGSFAVFYNTGGWTSMRFIVYAPQLGPGLSGQPKKQLAATGDAARFTVTGIGDEPMSYQWRKDGMNLFNGGRITGANTTNLTLANLALSDVGGYSVVVTNNYGSITSAPNVLTVVSPAPASYDVWGGDTTPGGYSYYNVNAIPGFVKLGTANRTATFNGKYNYYVVAVKKTELLFLDSAQSPTGAFYNNGSLATGNVGGGVMGSVQGPPDGRYLLLNGVGAGLSPDTYGSFAVFYNTAGWTNVKFFVYSADLEPDILTQPESQTVAAGATAQLKVGAFSEAPLSYQWRRNGTNLVNGGRVTGATSTNLAIATAQAADSGDYSVVVSNAYGMATSMVAVLNVVTPPSSFVLSDYFNPLVEGNEWHFTGTDYDGQPSTRVDRVVSRNYPVTAYTGRATPQAYITNLVRFNKAYGAPTYDDWDDFMGDQGAISFWGDDDGSESARVDGGIVFPQSLKLGQSVSIPRDFYANGVYQGTVTIALTALSWGSVTVPAGTFEDCLKVRIVFSMGGQSDTQEEWWAKGIGAVKHRNVPDNGEEQLDLVSYQVVNSPHLATVPGSRTNSLGATTTFAVTAWGTPTLAFQWFKDGLALTDDSQRSGTTTSNLVVTGLTFADAGSYTVVVTNAYGAITSAPAMLTVKDALPPALNITSHVELQLLGGTTTVLAGTASDAGLGDNGISSVTINGQRATNDTAVGAATASWTRAVTLTLGTNRLTVVARDGQGNTTTNTLRLLADTARPTLSVTLPAANARISNAVFTAQGKAADNLSLVEVRYQLNGANWEVATPSPGGWSNWSAMLDLIPGTNTLKACAVDLAGNRSLTNSVKFVRVLPAPLAVAIIGNGKVNGATNGQLFEIGKPVALTVTPATGWILTNWLVQVDDNTTISTNKAVPFLMAAETDLTARFVDVAKPVLTITAPKLNQRWSNEVFTITGKVTDNNPVGEVNYQLNGGEWKTATGWSNWTAGVTLVPGTNSVKAYAVDAAGNRSTTNSVNCFRVLPAPLAVAIIGNGKVNGATNGQLFEIGKPVALTVTPATGWILTNWLVQVDDNTTISTNKAVPFLMASNTDLTARFVDVAKPVLTITAPKLNQRWSNEVFTITGKVTDNNPTGEVNYQLNGGEWKTATGWSNWTASVELVPGTNNVKAYARDEAGNRSLTNSVNFVRVLTASLELEVVGNGKVNGATNGQRFEIGKSIALTVTPATGWILTNWLVQVEDNPILSTNKAVPFLMASNTEVTATFVDVAKPVLTITVPTANQRWSNEVFTVKGKVTDNNPDGEVLYQLNGGEWETASGWSNWAATVELVPGTNTVKAYARDEAGNRSATNSVNVIRVLTYCLADFFVAAPPGSRLIYDGLDWDGFPAQQEVRIDDTIYALITYTGTTVISNYVLPVLHVESAYGTYNTNTLQFFPYDDWDDYFILEDCSFGFMGSDDGDESVRIDHGFMITNRMAVGQTISTTRGVYLNGSYIGQGTFKLQLLEVSDVTVPAGTFPGCLHVRLTFSAGGESESHDDWLAPGVGMVKQQGVSGGGAAERWELVRIFGSSSARPLAANEPCPTASVAAVAPPSFELQDAFLDAATAQFSFRVVGPEGLNVAVEVSDDLTHWTQLQTMTLGLEAVQVLDPVPAGAPQRFYRVIIRP